MLNRNIPSPTPLTPAKAALCLASALHGVRLLRRDQLASESADAVEDLLLDVIAWIDGMKP